MPYRTAGIIILIISLFINATAQVKRGDSIKKASDTHSAFLKYLKANTDHYWVTTFSEALEYVSGAKGK